MVHIHGGTASLAVGVVSESGNFSISMAGLMLLNEPSSYGLYLLVLPLIILHSSEVHSIPGFAAGSALIIETFPKLY